MKKTFIAMLMCSALPAWADDLRPAPEYFIEAAVAANTALQIVDTCSQIDGNDASFIASTEVVLLRLTEDGFDPTADDLGMADPGEEFAKRSLEFAEKYDLTEAPTEAKVCAAGFAEMEAGSAIGLFLVKAGE